MRTVPLDRSNWGSKSKQAARAVILKSALELLGTPHIPDTYQYWTLCGQSVIRGKIKPGCEFDYVVQTNFCTPEQFHGIEGDPAIANENRLLPVGHWHQGEFSDVIANHYLLPTFRPCVIHLDTCETPSKGAPGFHRTIGLLAATKLPRIIILANYILDWHQLRKTTVAAALDTLLAPKNQVLRAVSVTHDITVNGTHTYEHNRVMMGTFVLTLQPHD